MNLMKNKTGKYFITIVCIFLIIALGVFLFFANKNMSMSNTLGFIGQKSNFILQSYQDAEKTLFYIDMSAKYSAPSAYFLAAYDGAMPEDSECGRYYDFAIWDFEDENCLPMSDANNNENFKSSFESKMNKGLNGYFKLAPQLAIVTDNYEINIFEESYKPAQPFSALEEKSELGQESKRIVVTGDTRVPLNFDIKKNVVAGAYLPYNIIYTNIKIPADAIGAMKAIDDAFGTFIKAGIEDAGGQSAVPEITESLMVALIYTESSGNICAVSSTGAKGITQFMPATAAEYGLCNKEPTPCSQFDYRCDPEKNIKASVKYIKHLAYDVYGKYTDKIRFALGSYNGGFKGESMIKRTGKENPTWEEILTVNNVAPETRNYVPKIIGLKQKFEEAASGKEQAQDLAEVKPK